MAWQFYIDCSKNNNNCLLKKKKEKKKEKKRKEKEKPMVEFRIFYQIFPLFYNVVDSQLPMIK